MEREEIQRSRDAYWQADTDREGEEEWCKENYTDKCMQESTDGIHRSGEAYWQADTDREEEELCKEKYTDKCKQWSTDGMHKSTDADKEGKEEWCNGKYTSKRKQGSTDGIHRRTAAQRYKIIWRAHTLSCSLSPSLSVPRWPLSPWWTREQSLCPQTSRLWHPALHNLASPGFRGSHSSTNPWGREDEQLGGPRVVCRGLVTNLGPQICGSERLSINAGSQMDGYWQVDTNWKINRCVYPGRTADSRWERMMARKTDSGGIGKAIENKMSGREN